jgi:hypothetical protein
MILLSSLAWAAEFHAIRLVDPSGQPFACVDLETTHRVPFRTDQDGVAAVYEPGLMGTSVWFTPIGDAVEVPLDFLGIGGFAVVVNEGGGTGVELDRLAPEGPCDEGDRSTRLVEHGVPTAAEHHTFLFLDGATKRPVPAVRLTLEGRDWWSDNGGHVAFFDLDRMDESVSFEVWTHGYAYGPGTVEVVPAPGGTTVITLDRTNLAERLVRLTGGGTWRDTVMLGLPAPAEQPLLDGQVVGQDSVITAPWRGGLFWVWGDTTKPGYPLGNFRAAAATSAVDATPEDGVDFDYFLDATGFTRGVAPDYPVGPVWLEGLVALDDDELWARYMNVASDFTILYDGMVRWDDVAERFTVEVEWDEDLLIRPAGSSARIDGADGDWVVFRNLTRIPADPASLADPASYQAYTPLVPTGGGAFTVATTADGEPDWQWRSDGPPPDGVNLAPELSPWSSTYEPDTDESPLIHNGDVEWSAFRGRWVHVFTESWGSSSLIGEIWYAEGDTPIGPWSWARKVVSHDGYSFYNPWIHPYFASDGGRRLVFEATYTGWLGTQPFTPRHDYNQFLYGMELDDPRLALPVPFYRSEDGPVPRHDAVDDAPVWFGGAELPGAETIPVHWSGPACDPQRVLALDGAGEVVFWALPSGTSGPGLASLVVGDSELEIVEGVAPDALATVWSPRWMPPVPLSLYPQPDRADAGPDQCGAVSPVTLTAAASVSTAPITSWSWSWAGGDTTGETVAVELPPGLHVVTLTATSAVGELTDRVTVEVVDDGGGTATTDTGDGGGGTPTDEGIGKRGCGCGSLAGGSGLLGWAAAVVLLHRRRRVTDRPLGR